MTSVRLDRVWRRLLAGDPCEGRHFCDMPVGHGGQAGEKVEQIGIRICTVLPAVSDEGVKCCGAVPGSGVADEEPVLFADGTGTDGVFDEVVVYASTRRWGSPGESPGWRHRSSQKHWERLQEETNELKYYQKRSLKGISEPCGPQCHVNTAQASKCRRESRPAIITGKTAASGRQSETLPGVSPG